jgi:hypothetical protein
MQEECIQNIGEYQELFIKAALKSIRCRGVRALTLKVRFLGPIRKLN